MASFGARLKQEREQRGITLDDISLSTKIGTRMLRALEEEHFDQLPGGIFNKGFIRAYARTLGMDEEQAIADYLVATGAAPPGSKPEDKLDNSDQAPIGEIRAQLERRAQEESPGPSSFPWGTLAVALLVVALGFAAWSFYSRESEKATPHLEADSGKLSSAVSGQTPAQAPPPQPAPLQQLRSQPSAPPSKPLESAASPAPASSPIQPAVSSSARSEASPATAPASTNSSQPSPAVQARGSIVVRISARQESWISITVDGEVTTRRTLAPSSQKTVVAQNELVIRAGNVGALDFAFNGKPLPPQGAMGEAKTLTFDAHGLQLIPPQTETPPPLP